MSSIPSIKYYNLVQRVRTLLLNSSNLPENRVINATSVRGPDIFKILDDTTMISPDLSDMFIIFEIKEDESSMNYYGYTTDNNTGQIIMPYTCLIKLYGSKCHDKSLEIISTIKSPTNIDNCRNNGFWITGITMPTAVNDFINNTVWPRTDFSINMQIKNNSYNSQNDSGIIKSLGNITILNIK